MMEQTSYSLPTRHHYPSPFTLLLPCAASASETRLVYHGEPPPQFPPHVPLIRAPPATSLLASAIFSTTSMKTPTLSPPPLTLSFRSGNSSGGGQIGHGRRDNTRFNIASSSGDGGAQGHLLSPFLSRASLKERRWWRPSLPSFIGHNAARLLPRYGAHQQGTFSLFLSDLT